MESLESQIAEWRRFVEESPVVDGRDADLPAPMGLEASGIVTAVGETLADQNSVKESANG